HPALPGAAPLRGDRRTVAALARRRPEALGAGRRAAARGTGPAAVNVDDSLPPDEQFASVLAAWDEALAAGATPGPATGGSPALWGRLERGLACLQRLRGLRPPDTSAPPTTDAPVISHQSSVSSPEGRSLMTDHCSLMTD